MTHPRGNVSGGQGHKILSVVIPAPRLEPIPVGDAMASPGDLRIKF